MSPRPINSAASRFDFTGSTAVADTPHPRSDLPDFEQIVDAYYPGLYKFAMSMCRREATAQDLVQQTFLHWARKGSTLRDAAKVKTWLFTTIYREYLGIARREKKHEHVEFEPDLHGSTQSENDAGQPRVDSVTLHLALDQLDSNYRAPLVLFYLQELSYRDIAETLSVPIGTVMSRISRAKNALRAILVRIEQAASLPIHPFATQPGA